MLAEVLEVRRFTEKLLDLLLDRQLLVLLEVSSRELLLDSAQHLQRARVLHLLLLRVLVAINVRHARAVAWTPGAAGPF
jgi:hypothetical protein